MVERSAAPFDPILVCAGCNVLIHIDEAAHCLRETSPKGMCEPCATMVPWWLRHKVLKGQLDFKRAVQEFRRPS